MHVDRIFPVLPGDLQVAIKHCRIVLALALYATTLHIATWWLTLTQTTEPTVVRIVKVILELTLGIILTIRLAKDLRKEFFEDSFPKLLHQPKLLS